MGNTSVNNENGVEMDSTSKFGIRDRECGNVIDESFSSREEADKQVLVYEQDDRNDDIYSADFYEVYKVEA